MDDYNKFFDPEELITCPYEQAHTLTRKRMAFHLQKCRKQHTELVKDFRECPFNVSHQIARLEYEVMNTTENDMDGTDIGLTIHYYTYHLETCADREIFYNAKYRIGQTENDVVPTLEQNILTPLEVPCDENWDETANPGQNIIRNIQQQAQDKVLLCSHSNESKSVRKAMREEDRRKAREKLNEEDRKRMAEEDRRRMAEKATTSSSSRRNDNESDNDDDAASNVSSNTYKSVISEGTDVSFQTAMSSARNRMLEFEEVRRKPKKIGRGSGQIPFPSKPNIQYGIGRGSSRK